MSRCLFINWWTQHHSLALYISNRFVWMLMIPINFKLEEVQQHANSIIPPFNQVVSYADFFLSEKEFDCPLTDLFNASFISLEEPEPILCGNWNLYHGTLTPEIIVWSVSVWRVGNLVTLDSCLMGIPHRLSKR